jgi:hypothetical protein
LCGSSPYCFSRAHAIISAVTYGLPPFTNGAGALPHSGSLSLRLATGLWERIKACRIRSVLPQVGE